ncbi:MAG: DUF3014 domain-containing protein [Cellvibrionaceae bacterium]
MDDNSYYQKDTFQMTPFLTIAGVIVLLVLMAWLWFSETTSPSEKTEVLEVPQSTEIIEAEPDSVIADIEPLINETVNVDDKNEEKPSQDAVEEAAVVLPSLQDSDGVVREALGEDTAAKALVNLLVPERIILKGVRAILALEEGDVVKDFRPLKSPEPTFKVKKIDEPLDRKVGQRYQISPKNYERYNHYIQALSSVDKKHVVSVYRYLYPLLEEAYLQYGVDKGGFDAVLIRVVDKIIASDVFEKTSESDRILIQPKVFYVFQNKKIENLSGVDKLLLRIGEKNTAVLKKELLHFKASLQQ